MKKATAGEVEINKQNVKESLKTLNQLTELLDINEFYAIRLYRNKVELQGEFKNSLFLKVSKIFGAYTAIDERPDNNYLEWHNETTAIILTLGK